MSSGSALRRSAPRARRTFGAGCWRSCPPPSGAHWSTSAAASPGPARRGWRRRCFRPRTTPTSSPGLGERSPARVSNGRSALSMRRHAATRASGPRLGRPRSRATWRRCPARSRHCFDTAAIHGPTSSTSNHGPVRTCWVRAWSPIRRREQSARCWRARVRACNATCSTRSPPRSRRGPMPRRKPARRPWSRRYRLPRLPRAARVRGRCFAGRRRLRAGTSERVPRMRRLLRHRGGTKELRPKRSPSRNPTS